jgi:hypothetical protein
MSEGLIGILVVLMVAWMGVADAVKNADQNAHGGGVKWWLCKMVAVKD